MAQALETTISCTRRPRSSAARSPRRSRTPELPRPRHHRWRPRLQHPHGSAAFRTVATGLPLAPPCISSESGARLPHLDGLAPFAQRSPAAVCCGDCSGREVVIPDLYVRSSGTPPAGTRALPPAGSTPPVGRIDPRLAFCFPCKTAAEHAAGLQPQLADDRVGSTAPGPIASSGFGRRRQGRAMSLAQWLAALRGQLRARRAPRLGAEVAHATCVPYGRCCLMVAVRATGGRVRPAHTRRPRSP
jgi:hypothetical protein